MFDINKFPNLLNSGELSLSIECKKKKKSGFLWSNKLTCPSIIWNFPPFHCPTSQTRDVYSLVPRRVVEGRWGNREGGVVDGWGEGRTSGEAWNGKVSVLRSEARFYGGAGNRAWNGHLVKSSEPSSDEAGASPVCDSQRSHVLCAVCKSLPLPLPAFPLSNPSTRRRVSSIAMPRRMARTSLPSLSLPAFRLRLPPPCLPSPSLSLDQPCVPASNFLCLHVCPYV